MDNTEKIVLEYGQRFMFPTYPCIPLPFGMGIQSIAPQDEPIMVEMELRKYWESDTDANLYKVALHPIKAPLVGIEKLYSSDLKQLIRQGTVKKI